MQDEGELLDRATVAQRWYAEEFVPAVRMLTDRTSEGRRDFRA